MRLIPSSEYTTAEGLPKNSAYVPLYSKRQDGVYPATAARHDRRLAGHVLHYELTYLLKHHREQRAQQWADPVLETAPA